MKYPFSHAYNHYASMKTSIMKYLQCFKSVLGRKRLNNFTQKANPLVQLVLLICKGSLMHVKFFSGNSVI